MPHKKPVPTKHKKPVVDSKKEESKKKKFTREMEHILLDEPFKPDITEVDKDGNEHKISSMVAGIKKIKKIMLTTPKEHIAVDIFFRLLERAFGKPVATLEASVETEVRNYSREEVIKMILDARSDKVIEAKQIEQKSE